MVKYNRHNLNTVMKTFSGIFFFLIMQSMAFGQTQNISDSLNTLGFARFLYDQKLYDLAAQEYERMVYFYPNEKKHLLSLFKCYRQLSQYAKIETKAKNANLDNPEILKEYLLSLAMNDQIEIARLIYKDKKTILNPDIADRMEIDFDVLQGKYLDAEKKYKSISTQDLAYNDIIIAGKSLKQKSPFAAGMFSTIVPGLGRVYAKDHKDGIISFIFIASTAFQSYTRFKINGNKSVGGWIYGGLSLGFYIGNIYGSVKSAKAYNKKSKNLLYEKSKAYINTFYSL